jgi:hypothetical protein
VSIVFVSGFQRCGSSLLMQMLAAGGLPVVHDPQMGYPSYETHLNLTGASLNAYDGHALKWLEPEHCMPPPVPFDIRVIWMARDHVQQARSAVKFMRAVAGLKSPDSAVRKLARSYNRSEAKSIGLWQRRGAVRILQFERLISDGRRCAVEIASFVGIPLNVDAMSLQVRPRSPRCLPELLELDLINDGGLA